MKEKNTKHKVRHGWILWMFPQQAKETYANDLIKITNKMINNLEENKEDDK